MYPVQRFHVCMMLVLQLIEVEVKAARNVPAAETAGVLLHVVDS